MLLAIKNLVVGNTHIHIHTMYVNFINKSNLRNQVHVNLQPAHAWCKKGLMSVQLLEKCCVNIQQLHASCDALNKNKFVCVYQCVYGLFIQIIDIGK